MELYDYRIQDSEYDETTIWCVGVTEDEVNRIEDSLTYTSLDIEVRRSIA